MTVHHYAEFGSVSTGTLSTEDLLSAFAGELKYYIKLNKGCRGIDLPAKRKLIKDAYRVSPESEEADEIVTELMDALQTFALPYTYFGALKGDGANFGFWPDPYVGVDDDLLPRFEAGVDLPEDFSGDCVLINDHGNMTVGTVNKRGEFKELWSVV